MKFKVKPNKSNLVMMTFVLILCLITCIFWVILKNYLAFTIYLIITIVLAHMYYFTSYIVNKNNLIIKTGFLKIKIKYQNIQKVIKKDDRIIIEFNNFNINLFPLNLDLFVEKINKEIHSKG